MLCSAGMLTLLMSFYFHLSEVAQHHEDTAFVPSRTVMTTACRMKPNYMGPDSPVRREFMEFCAANPMDSESLAPWNFPFPQQRSLVAHACLWMHAVISVECMPEACVLVKGKPRTRGLPAPTPVPADKDQAVREEDAGVGGAEEAAADLFKPKVKTAQVSFETCGLF